MAKLLSESGIATLCTVTTNESVPESEVKTGVARWSLILAGGLCTLLGAVGAFLPVLPTTPFLLLAAACFARSSPSFHRRLLENRTFGPYLVQWRSEHTVPPEAKRKALGLVVLSFGVSISFVQITWLRIVLGVVGVALLILLSRLPTPATDGTE